MAFYRGDAGEDVEALTQALSDRNVALSPMVLAEIFSDPELSDRDGDDLRELPLLDIPAGFWERAGKLRAALLRLRYRPRLIDTLIAQLCIEHDAVLLSRDSDFLPFARHAGLKLIFPVSST
jgi:predicted nucleic acid-binding protein